MDGICVSPCTAAVTAVVSHAGEGESERLKLARLLMGVTASVDCLWTSQTVNLKHGLVRSDVTTRPRAGPEWVHVMDVSR